MNATRKVNGYDVNSVLNISPAREYYAKAKRLGLADDARSEAIVTILESTHDENVGHRRNPMLIAFKIAVRLRSLTAREERHAHERLHVSTIDPHQPNPIDALPVDPFDLVPAPDREMVRDYMYAGSYRKLAAQSNLSRMSLCNRVNRALVETRKNVCA